MSGYGTCRWTCGECGEVYEADGVVGDMKVDRWRRDHKEEHRVERMSPDEQLEHFRSKALSWSRSASFRTPDAS